MFGTHSVLRFAGKFQIKIILTENWEKISTLNLNFHFRSDFSFSTLHKKPNHQSAKHYSAKMTTLWIQRLYFGRLKSNIVVTQQISPTIWNIVTMQWCCEQLDLSINIKKSEVNWLQLLGTRYSLTSKIWKGFQH